MVYCELKDLGGVFPAHSYRLLYAYIQSLTEIWRSIPSVGSVTSPAPCALVCPASVCFYALHCDLRCLSLMSGKKANVSVQFWGCLTSADLTISQQLDDLHQNYV